MALVAQGQLDCVTAGLSAAFFNGINRGLEIKFVASTGYQPKTGHPTALMMREDLYAAGAHDPGALFFARFEAANINPGEPRLAPVIFANEQETAAGCETRNGYYR